MAGVLGQFSGGPIQFNDNTGAIESRGTVDRSQPSVTQAQPTPAPAPQGGGVLPASPSLPQGDGGVGGAFGESFPAFPVMPRSFGGPSNGGSYGAGGQGALGGLRALGGGGLDGGGDGGGDGGVAFEDGGEVEDGGEYASGTPEQDQSATIDPMALIKQAASFGRKKFGLPSNFTTGEQDQSQPEQMGFEDGGMIPEEGGEQPAQQGGGMPDPRKALAYLTGDGAVSPEIANALEQHIDPQGQMDPAERTMAAISSAPSDEAKFGMMQHYRTRYNAYSAGAKAALDRGDIGGAAKHATEAFNNTPTGHKVRFAPAPGGVAVMASKLGQKQQQPQEQGFEAGGWVDKSRWDDLPQSENIEDRRDESEDDKRQFPQEQKTIASAGRKIGYEMARGFDRLRTAVGFEDGGEVPEEGVLPDPEQSAAPVEPVPETPASPGDGDEPMIEDVSAPSVLTTDQFKKLMSAGFDKPVDEGWEGLMNSIMNFIGPNSAEAAPLQQQGGGQTVVPKTKGDKQPVSPELQAQMDKPTPLSQVSQAQAAAKPAEDREAKYQSALERAQKTAQTIFPWASQQDQRANYVQQTMSHFTDNEGRLDVVQAQGRGNIANTREANKLTIEREKEAGRMQRQGNAAHSREDIARMNNQYRTFNSAQREQVRLLGQQLAADPSLAKDPTKAMARVQQLSQSLNINPKDLMAIIQNGGTPPDGGAQQQPQAPAGAKPTVVVFPSGPFAGKPMIRQPNGTYVPAQK